MRTAVAAMLAVAAATAPARGQSPASLPLDRAYDVLVGAEAVDQVARVRFGPDGARVVSTFTIGLNPMEPDGPHGVALDPWGRSLYVSTAHGTPFGSLWRLDPGTGRAIDRVQLGNFPASLQVSPDGAFIFVVNFNLHGEMVPSNVSVVSTDPFVEVARIQTCTMPHGSRLNAAGTRHYSTCMMDDMLVEIDAQRLNVARHFVLTPGNEHGMSGAPKVAMAHGGATGHAGHAMPAAGCSPTWAQPSPDGTRVYVACNRSNDIAEIDTESWTLRRRIPAGDGVYNLAVTGDGRTIVATNKRGQSVSIIDAASGRELARIPTLRKVVHGVAISADDRYAFISVEGIGSEPGTVEMIDLRTRTRIASVDVGQMAGGIDVMR